MTPLLSLPRASERGLVLKSSQVVLFHIFLQLLHEFMFIDAFIVYFILHLIYTRLFKIYTYISKSVIIKLRHIMNDNKQHEEEEEEEEEEG